MSEEKKQNSVMDAPTMNDLREFVSKHAVRGECKCGLCLRGAEKSDPVGPHVADMIFFVVSGAARGEEERRLAAAEFVALTRCNHRGDFCNVDVVDGREHGYMELGGWIGDQGAALLYMGLGVILGVFELRTPKTMLPGCPDEQAMQLAGMGMVSVAFKPLSASGGGEGGE